MGNTALILVLFGDVVEQNLGLHEVLPLEYIAVVGIINELDEALGLVHGEEVLIKLSDAAQRHVVNHQIHNLTDIRQVPDVDDFDEDIDEEV